MKSLTLTVQPVLVRDSAVQVLRNAIISGEIKSGTRLIERELCEALGVSRGSVREAIRRLEAERLITVEPRKGPVVTSLNAKQISDIYDIRMMLEAHVAECFTKVATDAHLERLREIYESLQQAIQAHDRVNVLVLIQDFNAFMADVVDNEAVRDTLGLLNARIASVRATAVEAPGRIESFSGELDNIFNAIVTRKPKLAKKAMENYVRAARDAALLVAADGRKASMPVDLTSSLMSAEKQ
ncbi:GntR family transcriptional regulator [Neoaquamicrobium sediminum]|uniref:GntR family transcriptional regulator n=1 Tax=Neoaquamicrobium sediminum TaxID=1849104 RepID=UPI00156604A1|nr:GntR family transcriptional regulator [Mesorhizobium sediminum]NRC57230.1 GntR family transcriptional regulator [Mesorhizobium sediminum]